MLESDLILLLIQLAALLCVGTIMGCLADKLGFPKVAGELVGGILLGPTVLGTLSPESMAFLFPASGPSFVAREGFVKIGLLFFLLFAGMELNRVHLKSNGRSVIWSSLFGIVIPFSLGWSFVMVFPVIAGAAGLANRQVPALFLGTALSISALPVIAKILMDLRLIRDRFGTLVMSAATIDDLVGWTLFSALLSHFRGGIFSWQVLGLKSLALFAVVAVVIFLERPVQAFFARCRTTLHQNVLISFVLGLTLLGAAAAQAFGIHAVFGAFLVGALLAPGSEHWDELHSAISRFVSNFFAPLYFTSLGLKVNFAAHFDLKLVFAVLLIACVGKISGVMAGARLGGLPRNEALALGFAMNARGAMEIILASIALEHGMIHEAMFVALVIMALVTSIMSGPAIRSLLAVRTPAGAV